MPRQLFDPRSGIVSGSHEISIEVAAQEDIVDGLKMHFGDIYYNDTLGIGFSGMATSTLADLSRQHANCYHEAQRLRSECLASGTEFNDDRIRKAMAYHIKMAETINGIIGRRLEAKKMKGEG